MSADTIGNKFSRISKLFPNKPALYFEKEKVTFKQLDLKSNKIVDWFYNNNIKKQEVVCITSAKVPLTFYILIACLKFGLPYTFLDRKSPKIRNKKIINTLKPKIIFCDELLQRDFFGEKNIIIKNINDFKKIFNNKKKNNEKNKLKSVNPSDIAYIMFTSGSTGLPKGVAISHQNVINFINWSKKRFQISKNDIFSNLNSLFFDNSVFDIYASLFNGASLVPINRTQVIDPNTTINFLDKFKVTIWFSVPSLIIYFQKFYVFNKKSLKNLKKIIFGGEGFQKNRLKSLYNTFKNRVRLINVYGPTECTCICSAYEITNFDFKKNELYKLAPLGKNMVQGFYYKILNKKYKQVKKNEIGELYLGGDNVGLGYYSLEKETKSKFVQNPQHNNYKDIMYKTGDLVYKDNKTNLIYFSSRIDNQIKYMGYRIELGEIENTIGAITKVNEVAVLFGLKNKVEEITCWISHNNKDIENIKNNVTKLLPIYMIPKRYIELKQLPKNNNGKINRKYLAKFYDRKKN